MVPLLGKVVSYLAKILLHPRRTWRAHKVIFQARPQDIRWMSFLCRMVRRHAGNGFFPRFLVCLPCQTFGGGVLQFPNLNPESQLSSRVHVFPLLFQLSLI